MGGGGGLQTILEAASPGGAAFREETERIGLNEDCRLGYLAFCR